MFTASHVSIPSACRSVTWIAPGASVCLYLISRTGKCCSHVILPDSLICNLWYCDFPRVLVVVMTAIFFALDQLPSYRRMFSLQDKTIMFPHAQHEHVPVWLLLVRPPFLGNWNFTPWIGSNPAIAFQILCFIVPLVTISAYSMVVRKSVRDFHNGVLGRMSSLCRLWLN